MDDRGQRHCIIRWGTHMLLKEDDVEDIMNARLSWKMEMVCNVPNTFHHLERTEEPGASLLLVLSVMPAAER
jgi:hypothetical protein